ncbi:MAG TPA: S4 domain-containing protein, partial [Thermoanaerobaculia bacterium]|nr:S4 domain-containing protein [Thermoanaerobaculia bacterium]
MKKRLDVLLVERGLADSRTRAEALILAGRVAVAGKERVKPGTPVDDAAVVSVGAPEHPWVSRGGVKLDFGLARFGIDPAG